MGGGGSPVGWHGHEVKEREEGATGCSSARSRGRTRWERKGGCDSDGAPFIGDTAGVGDGPRVAPHGDEALGQLGGRAARGRR
jgi:hypothetical protein